MSVVDKNIQIPVNNAQVNDIDNIFSQYHKPDTRNYNRHVQKKCRYIKRVYNPIKNCKAAGIIPYTIIDNTVHFLFQKMKIQKKKITDGTILEENI